MKKIITILLFIQLLPAMGQTNNKIEKAVTNFKSGEMDKGISQMQKVTDKDPSNENWDLLITMYYARFQHREKVAISLTNAILESLGVKAEPEKSTSANTDFNEFIEKCREANLYSQSPSASRFMRNFLVDYFPKNEISEEAQKEFNSAERYFGKKDYENSMIHYQNALNLQPDFYQATIYLGDSYWYLEKMDSAIHYFRKGIEMCPDLLEPRKYLVDALGALHKNKEATKECIDAICIYPDLSMYMKYADLLKWEGLKFNQHWLKRGCNINKMGSAQTKIKKSSWTTYQKAQNDIKDFCDNKGIIVHPNTLTKTKYLEVYSWEKMLENPDPKNEFAFAKKMADNGFLDCYVFISVFHYDFYDQYKDFVKNNKERIITYIDTYLTE